MLHRFEQNIEGITPPAQFTWPFHYVPHALSRLAAEELQRHLHTHPEWAEEIAAGKMFGVLVVRDANGELGFLAAFSGNLAGTNRHPYFVPPVYDMLQPDDFFRREEAEISAINRLLATIEQGEEYSQAKRELESAKQHSASELSTFKATLAERKQQRQLRREQGEDNATLTLESQRDNADLQRLKRHLREMVATAQQAFDSICAEVSRLKEERQRRSAALQMQLFAEFRMLNARGQVRDLCELFAPTTQQIPPAGAGECAAPKLLQYAYMNGLHPVAMAEFWQGASPRGEVRHHGAFYPACVGKCKPILEWMMQGLDVEPNPLMEIRPAEPDIIWEDEWLVAINKPCGMLSVKGKSGVRSAEEWAHERYPDATGPMIIHRLDQSTSGILLIAKDKATHEAIQRQFITRYVEKRYTALLDGVVECPIGIIDLAMKLDYENRPRQMVAEDGKRAITEYEVLSIEGNQTRILFHPITGRTHQLRLHAAHHKGLCAPIVGDDIYGHECHADLCDGHRLCLHASEIEFTHPRTGERVHLHSKAEF